MTYDKVLKAALALNAREQNELIGRVYDQLHANGENVVGPEWLAEIQRRSEEMDRGTAKMVSYETAKRRVRRLKQSLKTKR